MDTRRLDLNLLLALDALLMESNVTRAARRLHLSQPALSARLRRLRSIFRDPLLVPAQKGMIPTQRALELREPLREALEKLYTVIAERTPFDPAQADLVINIAGSDYVQCVLLRPLMAALKRQAPQMRCAWRQLNPPALFDQMERTEIDLAIMTVNTAPAQLRSRTLFSERYVFIARRNHPRIRRSVDLDTFVELEHVVVSPRGGGFSGPTDAVLRSRHRSRRVALSVATFLIVPEIVAQSDLVAVVPERLVGNHADRLLVREPPVPIAGFTMGMVWHERTTAHPAHRWFRETLAGVV